MHNLLLIGKSEWHDGPIWINLDKIESVIPREDFVEFRLSHEVYTILKENYSDSLVEFLSRLEK
jgi:hypothetical protein